jgi:hypothetical protein
LTDDHRFVTVQWNAHFVLYSVIVQSDDDNVSQTPLVCACDELDVGDCVGVTVVSCKHDARIPLLSICYCVWDFEFGIAVLLAPQHLA